jgi:hypothetical protein
MRGKLRNMRAQLNVLDYELGRLEQAYDELKK